MPQFCFNASPRNFVLLILFAVFQTWILFTCLKPTEPKVSHTFKMELAARMHRIHVDLLSSLHNSRPPSHTSLLKLGHLIQQLDPRVSYYEQHPGQNKDDNYETNENPETLDVCPESWKGRIVTDNNYPFYPRGFEISNCTKVKPLEKVVSILINIATDVQKQKLNPQMVLKGIKDTYPKLRMFVAATRSSLELKKVRKFTNVEVVEVPKNHNSPGKVWNDLLSFVSTPYVLIGRDLAHFSWLSQIERLVRAISTIPHVAISGGSFRNSTGHWRVGCYQTELKNYVLDYKEGYYYSREDCMYCDHLQGPFVARTGLLRELSFDEVLNKEVVFEDLFLRVSEKKHLVMNCPDVMYFTGADYEHTTKPKESNKQLWTALATKWTLNRIFLPGGIRHAFSCRDINYKCKLGKSSSLGLALPVCCQEQFSSALQLFHNFCVKNNLPYELESGSVMGVVKFRDLLPWDVDGDLTFYNGNFSFFNRKETLDYFSGHGCPLKEHENGTTKYFTFYTPDMYVECWGYGSLSPYLLPHELQHIPTKTRLHGVWLHTAYSPARFARNRYGRSILKHAQHWSTLGMAGSYKQYEIGTFKACSEPGHHACLDRFPTDGNIPFLVQ